MKVRAGHVQLTHRPPWQRQGSRQQAAEFLKVFFSPTTSELARPQQQTHGAKASEAETSTNKGKVIVNTSGNDDIHLYQRIAARVSGLTSPVTHPRRPVPAAL